MKFPGPILSAANLQTGAAQRRSREKLGQTPHPRSLAFPLLGSDNDGCRASLARDVLGALRNSTIEHLTEFGFRLRDRPDLNSHAQTPQQVMIVIIVILADVRYRVDLG